MLGGAKPPPQTPRRPFADRNINAHVWQRC
jgi:hypothetical protein